VHFRAFQRAFFGIELRVERIAKDRAEMKTPASLLDRAEPCLQTERCPRKTADFSLFGDETPDRDNDESTELELSDAQAHWLAVGERIGAFLVRMVARKPDRLPVSSGTCENEQTSSRAER